MAQIMSYPGTLYSISAPSGAGKTSLVKALLNNTDRLCVSISHTTRSQRPGEADGKDYHFVDEQQFLDLQQQNIFLENATVFGHYYGTSKIWVQQQLAAGRDVLLEIDWQGQQIIKQQLPVSVSIFILPPSKQALAQRLEDRAQDSQAVIDKRMQQAQAEMSHCLEYDYLIINDDFETALADLSTIIHSQRLRIRAQQHHHATLIEQLIGQK